MCASCPSAFKNDSLKVNCAESISQKTWNTLVVNGNNLLFRFCFNQYYAKALNALMVNLGVFSGYAGFQLQHTKHCKLDCNFHVKQKPSRCKTLIRCETYSRTLGGMHKKALQPWCAQQWHVTTCIWRGSDISFFAAFITTNLNYCPACKFLWVFCTLLKIFRQRSRINLDPLIRTLCVQHSIQCKTYTSFTARSFSCYIRKYNHKEPFCHSTISTYYS